MITWCVFYTQPLKEYVAKQHLIDQEFQVYLPQFKKTRIHARKVDVVVAPLFPRYVFVGLDLNKDGFRPIQYTCGFSYVVIANALNSAKVPLKIIQALKQETDNQGFITPERLDVFNENDRVRIIEGAFKEHTTIFQHMDDKRRVHLLLHFLSRDMTIHVSRQAVEAA